MTIIELIEYIDNSITKTPETRDSKAQIATLHERVTAFTAESDDLKIRHAALEIAHSKVKEENAKLLSENQHLKSAREKAISYNQQLTDDPTSPGNMPFVL